jgi:hypothetical protein
MTTVADQVLLKEHDVDLTPSQALADVMELALKGEVTEVMIIARTKSRGLRLHMTAVTWGQEIHDFMSLVMFNYQRAWTLKEMARIAKENADGNQEQPR